MIGKRRDEIAGILSEIVKNPTHRVGKVSLMNPLILIRRPFPIFSGFISRVNKIKKKYKCNDNGLIDFSGFRDLYNRELYYFPRSNSCIYIKKPLFVFCNNDSLLYCMSYKLILYYFFILEESEMLHWSS